MSALRRALYGGEVPGGLVLRGSSPLLEATVLALTTALLLLFAVWVARRKPTNV